MSKIYELSKCYFSLRDTLYDNGGLGYTKSELHDLVKRDLLPMLFDEDNYWNEIQYSQINLSTKDLSEEGWKEFIALFKSYCITNFNFYL